MKRVEVVLSAYIEFDVKNNEKVLKRLKKLKMLFCGPM